MKLVANAKWSVANITTAARQMMFFNTGNVWVDPEEDRLAWLLLDVYS